MKTKKAYRLIQEVCDEVIIDTFITQNMYNSIIYDIEHNTKLKEDENYALQGSTSFNENEDYYKVTLTYTIACTHTTLIMYECKKGKYFNKFKL